MADEYIMKREVMWNLDGGTLTRDDVRRALDRCKSVEMLDRDKGKEPLLKSDNGIVGYACKTDGTCEDIKAKDLSWVCPNCGWFVGELYSGFGQWHIQGDLSYCARCGQKIDWTLPQEEEKRRYEEYRAEERERWEKERQMRLDNMFEGKRRKYGVMPAEEG